MAVAENERLARRFFEELWNTGDLELAHELVAAEHRIASARAHCMARRGWPAR